MSECINNNTGLSLYITYPFINHICIATLCDTEFCLFIPLDEYSIGHV